MKLLFKSTPMMKRHAGPLGTSNDGDEKEFPDEIAEGFLKDFPENYFPADEGKKAGKIAGMKVPKKDGDK